MSADDNSCSFNLETQEVDEYLSHIPEEAMLQEEVALKLQEKAYTADKLEKEKTMTHLKGFSA